MDQDKQVPEVEGIEAKEISPQEFLHATLGAPTGEVPHVRGEKRLPFKPAPDEWALVSKEAL